MNKDDKLVVGLAVALAVVVAILLFGFVLLFTKTYEVTPVEDSVQILPVPPQVDWNGKG